MKNYVGTLTFAGGLGSLHICKLSVGLYVVEFGAVAELQGESLRLQATLRREGHLLRSLPIRTTAGATEGPKAILTLQLGPDEGNGWMGVSGVVQLYPRGAAVAALKCEGRLEVDDGAERSVVRRRPCSLSSHYEVESC